MSCFIGDASRYLRSQQQLQYNTSLHIHNNRANRFVQQFMNTHQYNSIINIPQQPQTQQQQHNVNTTQQYYHNHNHNHSNMQQCIPLHTNNAHNQ